MAALRNSFPVFLMYGKDLMVLKRMPGAIFWESRMGGFLGGDFAIVG